MGKNRETLVRNYLANTYVNLVVAAYTHCPENWRDIDYLPDYNKFYYICSGDGWLKVGDEEFRPGPGQLCLMPAGKLQSYSVTDNEPFTKYWCHFTAAVGETNLFDIIRVPLVVDVQDHTVMEGLFNKLISAYGSSEVTASLIARSALTEILARYIDLAGKKNIHLPETTSVEKILGIVEYIDAHISEDITIEKLAGITGYHPNYFIRFFKKHLGSSPAHYIYKKRLEKAKGLMELFDHVMISEIAVSVGFHDVYHFSKAFKNYTGFSPTEFKRMLLK